MRVVRQDDHYKPLDSIRRVTIDGLELYNYDEPAALDEAAICMAILSACPNDGQPTLVLIEGTMLVELPRLRALADRFVFLTADQTTCRTRRAARTDYAPSDPRESLLL